MSLQEERRERFNKKFWDTSVFGADPKDFEELLSFLDTECDKAVQGERERFVKLLNQIPRSECELPGYGKDSREEFYHITPTDMRRLKEFVSTPY